MLEFNNYYIQEVENLTDLFTIIPLQYLRKINYCIMMININTIRDYLYYKCF